MAASATKYFNCKVNVFSKDEIILLLLLSGVSFEMLKMLCKEAEIKMIGLPRDINEKAFSTNPEIWQHAIPNSAENVMGYLLIPLRWRTSEQKL